MALRLIEMVLQEKDGGKVLDLLKEHEILEHRQIRLSDGEVLVRILLDAEQSEAVLDLLEKDFSGREGNRIVILPVEATLPRAEPLPPAMSAQPPTEEKSPERISREELYEDIKDAAHCSRVYLAMVLSAIIGVLMNVDPTLPELALRTQVRVGDVMLALASGCAGALAFTSGVSATLIGVMVAVALMPPLVTFGLLVGGGYPILAMGALLLFLVNLICINLAGVITFQIQGIHPATWWETDRATKVTRIALGLRSLSS